LSFLDQLNPQQREAVETTEGPVLILAGAGSGKTRVITYRIAYLIEHMGVMPESILAMTFTNKAAAEMGERVEKLVGGLSIAKPVISTFHSFCVRVLRRDIEAMQIPSATPGKPALGHTKKFVIYDESDQQSVVKSVMKRLGLDDKQLTPRTVLSRISWAKNHMLDPQELYLQSADPKTEKIAHLFEEYRKELRKANALDFDDLLLEATRLLKTAAPVREYYNRRFQYLLIDEYQDTNRPQYELMRMLAGERHNVCAVGDEDQSIYSWRGADIRNILEFEKDFPEAKIIRLEQNYRSTQNILQAASSVVANNIRRKGKNLWTSRQGGTKIGYYEAPDGENEALFAADHIAKYLREAAQRGETPRAAVLYRTNSQSRLFEEAMRRYGLKYKVVGGFSFYERAEIKDLISYLKVIQNPDDSISLLRVINTPTRGIGKGTIDTLERLALETGLSLWGALGEAIRRQLLPQRALAALKSFQQLIVDAQAILSGTFAEQLEGSVEEVVARAPSPEPPPEAPPSVWGQPPSAVQQGEALLPATDDSAFNDAAAFDPAEFENFSFDFGANDLDVDQETNSDQPSLSQEEPRAANLQGSPRRAWTRSATDDFTRRVEKLARAAAKRRLDLPVLKVNEIPDSPGYYDIEFQPNLKEHSEFKLVGTRWHNGGRVVDLMREPGCDVPAEFLSGNAECKRCSEKKVPNREYLTRIRKYTYLLRKEDGQIDSYGSDCFGEVLGLDPEHFKKHVEELSELGREISSGPDAEIPPPVRHDRPIRTGSQRREIVEKRGVQEVVSREPSNEMPEELLGPASLPDLLKFLIDRTGYIKLLEEEDTPDAFSRIENLRELVNAAMDSRDRGESLDQFLDHAALISDADDYDERAQITLMSLHAAKGLEFPLVFLSGLEEGLFPHSRTMLQPDDVEEERRLCYVGMTRAMDQLILTRAVYRRRYGTDLPEASVPSRFLEEVPIQLVEELGGAGTNRVGTGTLARPAGRSPAAYAADAHYSYEDEDQSASWRRSSVPASRQKPTIPAKPYNSIENIAEFFASRGKKFTVPKTQVEEPSGKRGFRPGQKVRHPKYGEGTVYQREGEGEEAKITVQFPRFGLKKLVEKYAQLERA
jgi:superfamily I DNA/RNA helicase